MNINCCLNLLIFTYLSFFQGLGAEYHLIAKNGSILTTNWKILRKLDPDVVSVIIYENNINKTGYEF
jgi:hypothetical protein